MNVKRLQVLYPCFLILSANHFLARANTEYLQIDIGILSRIIALNMIKYKASLTPKKPQT